MDIQDYGLTIPLPNGWDGRIYRQTPLDAITLEATSARLASIADDSFIQTEQGASAYPTRRPSGLHRRPLTPGRRRKRDGDQQPRLHALRGLRHLAEPGPAKSDEPDS